MRIFFGISLPEPVRDAVAEVIRPLRSSAANISWTRRDNLHLTLRFVGDAEPEHAERLADAVTPWARRLGAPSVVLAGGGAFPDASRPRTLWIGVRDPERVGLLARAIDAAIEPFGHARPDRDWVGHLTVGRVRDGRGDRAAAQLLDLGEIARFRPEALLLYAAEEGPGGVRYRALRTMPFG